MNNKELAFSVKKDRLKIDTFCAGGPGGQNQNKRSMGVRITHLDSGAVAESREERSQHQNMRNALKRLSKTKEFYVWVQRQLSVLDGQKSVEEQVAEDMNERNIIIEAVDETGKWIIYT